MNRRRRTSVCSPLVLLVGGDSETARSCARAASPLPVVRAKHMATATSRLESMKPVALVVAAGVPSAHVAELERLASEHAAEVVRFDGADAPEALRRVARE